jgi:hypoxanthine phosphoribosyltransferase
MIVKDEANNLPQQIYKVYAQAERLYSKHEVESAFDQMADKIRAKLANTNPIFLCVVIGGIIPMGNLLPRLDFPLEVDYIHVTRYKGTTKGSNSLHWKAEPSCSLQNRTVVVVDDILDGGLTLARIVEYCKIKGANAVYSAVLVDKLKIREPGGMEKADFSGLKVDNRYVFGYGMDYKEYLRNAPGIFAVTTET